MPFGHVLAAAAVTGRSPAAVADRLRRLGFDVRATGADGEEAACPPSVERVDLVDLVLLGRHIDGRPPWLGGGGRLPAAHLRHAACVLGCDVNEVRDRYARLGFVVPAHLREMSPDERAVVTVAFYRTDTTGLGDAPISVATVLGVAEFGNRRPDEVADVFAELDLPVDGDLLDQVQRRLDSPSSGPSTASGLNARDALLLSAWLDGCGPWLGNGPVGLAHVIGAAGYLRWSPGRVVERLAMLGCEVPALTEAARTAFIDGVDCAIVDILRDGPDGPLVDRPFSRAEILVASWTYRWTPRWIVDRLAELGFAVPDRDTFDR
ncbi:hypothetical protein FRACA_130050 [Frankia canadensis]|uniref:wHTH-Hsp90 Na associated domain-containing protein n=1 Tax=Frankia canadensis TaxID=1836972 RepID=A0A2I2KKP9_9ACTN|nr:hypothetical protein FRACA_130050 [Frankia canadensis]SOU53516.1 hypothetical protein FRACA_130050 [Frankia canadensis]